MDWLIIIVSLIGNDVTTFVGWTPSQQACLLRSGFEAARRPGVVETYCIPKDQIPSLSGIPTQPKPEAPKTSL